MLDKLMQKFVKEELEGIESLATEVPGVYALPVDAGVDVLISDIPRGFTLACTLLECKPENEEQFYQDMLFANLFGQGTEGCILGLDAEGKRLTLSRDIDYNIDYKEFKDIIEDFLNSVDFWRQEAQSYAK